VADSQEWSAVFVFGVFLEFGAEAVVAAELFAQDLEGDGLEGEVSVGASDWAERRALRWIKLTSSKKSRHTGV
jgi:hypothetical protein